jgi:hypothetical protein
MTSMTSPMWRSSISTTSGCVGALTFLDQLARDQVQTTASEEHKAWRDVLELQDGSGVQRDPPFGSTAPAAAVPKRHRDSVITGLELELLHPPTARAGHTVDFDTDLRVGERLLWARSHDKAHRSRVFPAGPADVGSAISLTLTALVEDVRHDSISPTDSVRCAANGAFDDEFPIEHLTRS